MAELLAFAMNAKLTFLIVDDDADGRFLTRRAVAERFKGCDVLEAATAEETLAKAVDGRPDVVVTECSLGCEDGAALIARCRAAGVGCRIIVLTGNANPTLHARAVAAGADGVFSNWESEYLSYLSRVLRSSQNEELPQAR
jgi:CheY-like chemotaxis protein